MRYRESIPHAWFTAGLACLLVQPGASAASPRNIVTKGQATAQQQIVDFDLSDPSDLANCKVVVYSDAARTQVIPDSDTTISPNAQSCNRGALNGDLSSIVSQTTHVQFISGLRGTRKSAADGHLYSMSLSPLTTYYYTISAGGGSVQGQFNTENIDVGQNFPDKPLYDNTGTNVSGFQYPFMPDAPGVIVDPTTGIPIRKVVSIQNDMGGLTALNTIAIDLTGGMWTNLANCGTKNLSTCSSTGAGPSDYLFLPLPFFPPPQNGSLRFGGWDPHYSVQDIVFSIYCGATGSPQTLRVWLTRDSGQTPASTSFDVPCPVGSSSLQRTLSDTANGYPHPWFSQWNPVPQWIKAEVIPGSGNVNTNGTAVTLASGDPFITSIPAGSSIMIGGSYYKIAGFKDSTHLTLTGSAGTQTSVSYTMASTGLRIANITGTNTVTLSVGFNPAETTSSGYGTFNADLPPCNINAINISTDASGGAIGSTKGYLCSDLEGSVFLYVPLNADGSVRLEMRPLSRLTFTVGTHVDLGGDQPIGNGSGVIFGGWDSTDPLSLYGMTNYYGGKPIFKVRYDTTISSACAKYQAYSSGNANGFNAGTLNADCFQYTNLTPQSAGKGGFDQVKAAYATGLNQLGQQVGAAHPMMSDIGWMQYFGFTLGVVGNMGCVTAHSQSEGFSVNACFDLKTGILKSLVDSFSTWPAIGGGSHGWNALGAAGLTWTEGGDTPMFDGYSNAVPFNHPFEAAVSQINLAGFGAPPSWTSSTAIDSSKMFTCPAFSDANVLNYFGSFSGTQNCLQVRITTPLCNHNPAPNAAGGGYDFAGGKSESQAYPCSTPGFGVSASNPDARSWSKLWDILPGMWLWDKTTNDKYSENFVVAAAPFYNTASDITVWLLRTVKDKYFVPRNSPLQPGNCVEAAAGKANHGAGWTLSVFPPFACGFVGYWWDVNDPTGTMFWDNTQNGHGVIGAGSIPNTFTRISFGNEGYYYTNVNQPAGADPNGFINQTPTANISTNMRFAGFSGIFTATQSYGNLTSATPLADPINRKFIDNRAVNPSQGVGAETLNLCLSGPLSLTPQPGTAQTYLIGDPTGTIATTDPHVSVLAGWAGSHYLRDYSSPATGNVFGDAQSYGFCYVYQNNECRAGSTAGHAYVSVPFAENPNACIQTGQNTLNVPGLYNMGPVNGQTMQADPYTFDPTQTLIRKLGFGFRAPGMQYTYQHTWGMPDGKAIMGRMDWADGKFAGLYVGAIPPWPAVSSNTTNGYYSLEKSPLLPPAAPKVRYLFGYAENGSTSGSPTANLYCMSRLEVCSTEGKPFAFVQSDSRALLNCTTGCTVPVPLIRGRVAFIQEQRLSSDGSTVVSHGPVQAIAMP